MENIQILVFRLWYEHTTFEENHQSYYIIWEVHFKCNLTFVINYMTMLLEKFNQKQNTSLRLPKSFNDNKHLLIIGLI